MRLSSLLTLLVAVLIPSFPAFAVGSGNGKVVINPVYEYARPFSEGLAAVQLSPSTEEAGWTFIDGHGRRFSAKVFKAVFDFQEGLVAVLDAATDLWGFVDREGNYVIPPLFERVTPFSDGVAVVCRSKLPGGCALVNKQADVVADFPYALPRVFAPGLFTFSTEWSSKGRFGVMNKRGEIVIEPQFNFISSLSDGLAMIVVGGDLDKGKYGFIDGSGKYVFNPEFDYASPFVGGFASVSRGKQSESKSGVINRAGQQVIPYRHTSAHTIGEGLFVLGSAKGEYVHMGMDYKVVDRKGSAVSNLRITDFRPFSDGLAAVNTGTEESPAWGFMDRLGKMTIKGQFSELGFFKQGLAPFKVGTGSDARWGYLAK